MRTGILKAALLGAAAVGMISLAGAGVARADSISVGFQVGTGSIASVTTNTLLTGGISYSATTNDYNTGGYGAQGSAFSTAGPIFKSQSLDISSTAANTTTVHVYVTDQGLTRSGPYPIESYLQTNSIDAANISQITMTTYVDKNNGDYNNLSSLTPLATGNFTKSNQHNVSIDTIAPGSLYSLTSVYAVTFTGGSTSKKATANLEIDMLAVPEPGSLALLGTGLLGLGLVARRRRRKA